MCGSGVSLGLCAKPSTAMLLSHSLPASTGITARLADSTPGIASRFSRKLAVEIQAALRLVAVQRRIDRELQQIGGAETRDPDPSDFSGCG